jgi:glycosyltransferase involved in cell wall biosynthesis
MVLKDKKMIYVLNHYSSNSSQHFFHVLNLLEEIANRGVFIKLIIEKSEGEPTVKNQNIDVLCLKNSGFKRLVELYKLVAKAQKEGYGKLFVRISNWAAIAAIVNSFFSKLEVHYWHSGTVFGFDNEQSISFKKIKWYLKTRLPFNFIKSYVTFFVTGPESMEEYYTNVVGVNPAKIKILYNDIDTSRFSIISKDEQNKIKSELNIPIDEKIILFVHNFSPVRRTKLYVTNFLEKFEEEKNNHDYKFYFIGSGADKQEIEAQIIEKGLNHRVCFLGALPNAIVHQYYQIADIFINPTHAEGFPRVLIEAMACGLPIVTTNAGGIKDILGEQQLNYMSDIDDPDRFATNLIMMAQLTSNELDLIRDENLESIKKYSTSNVALMYIKTVFNE